MEDPKKSVVIFSAYFEYRAKLRGFGLSKIEKILRYSEERYFDTVTGRFIAVGQHDKRLVIIPYEKHRKEIIPVTVHATTRIQIRFRLKTGRFVNE